jgi:N-acetylmuramoyl-L-alanine amidase
MIYVVLRDGGHGKDTRGKETPFIKSLGRRIQEEEFNEPVSALFGEEMERHGVIVHDVSPGTHDVSLKDRTDEANRLLNHYINKYGAANVRVVLISFHFNAFDGSFVGSNPSGISVHIQPGSSHARRLAECVGKHLKKGTKQVYRGIVEQNLHMTREFQGVGILTENGFMDHPDEAMLMLDKEFQKEVSRETAQGVLEYFGLEYKSKQTVKQTAAKTKPETVFLPVKVNSDRYGMYSEPKTKYKESSSKYRGWIFVARKKVVIEGQVWYELMTGDNSFGWASQAILESVPYKWATVKEDTVGYVHADMKIKANNIRSGSRIAILQEHDEKYLVISSVQPQWIYKQLVK